MVNQADIYEVGSVIQLVDFILEKAIDMGASDVHFESTSDCLRVRYRIDGVLYDQRSIDADIMRQFLSRLKVLSSIDITEKRVPQDGKFRIVRSGNDIDIRVSTFPSVYGEKIVVRILDRADNTINLEYVGLSSSVLKQIRHIVGRANGFFLVTGPTGSGKTTTLYAALSLINSPEKNIITLEDPVEYNLPGITQGQINTDVGFTFEKGIRAILRQDPDVILVGEIRDVQTARIAIEAALTGHLVFSTLHTNDSSGAIMRLMDMGIEPFLINAALSGVLAQRLVRKICTNCMQMREPNDQEKALLGRLNESVEKLGYGAGCDSCLQLGYKGRIGIFEFLPITSDLRSLVVKEPSCDDIYAQAQRDGMVTLSQDGMQKVRAGVISLSELMRVIV